MSRQLDIEVTPAQQYLSTPAGQSYRSFVNGFHCAVVDFNKRGSKDNDNNHDMRSDNVALPEANVIGSKTVSGLHYPVLDIDVPAMLVPSSTPDHSHLYIKTLMEWRKYAMLLEVLAAVGILEDGFVGAANPRQETFARTPWIRK
jgi:hypothetical protein